MILLLQMASRFVGGIAFAIMFTIVLAIAIRYFANEKETNASLDYLRLRESIDRVVAWKSLIDAEVTIEKVRSL